MLGGLLGVQKLVSQEAVKEALLERFGGGKFVASGTTAALDDVLKSKFNRLAHLVERNVAVLTAAGGSVEEYHLGD
jgi:pyruvate ferredoxin oxidoreductase gamma subunit